MPRDRLVFDTNALVSRLLIPGSVPARALRKAVTEATLICSEATLEELADVLSRPKFDPYITVAERQQFLRLLGRIAEPLPIVHRVEVCRDPRDDKFLELAVNGDAAAIVTGDHDLLTLNPFREIPVLSPQTYLDRWPTTSNPG